MTLRKLNRRSPAEFLEDKSGAVAVLVALGLVALFGIAALAVDMSYMYMLRGKLQAAADATALAAVTQLPDETAVRNVALDYATKNMSPSAHGAVLASNNVVTGNWDAGTRTFTPAGEPKNAVQVVTQRSQANGNAVGLFFARVLGFDQVDVVASAIATSSIPLCVLALDTETGIPALEVSGSAIVDTPDCHIHSNQPGSESISVSGSGSIMAGSSCAVGDIVGPENITPAPQTGCAPILDPMADIPEPPFTGCDFNNLRVGGTQTITPGVYCGGLEIESNANITLAPGLYYMENGRFEMPGNVTVTGDGVTIYFDGDSASYMRMRGGPSFHLSAPTSGTYAGVAFFGSRDQPPSTKHEFVGTGNLFVDGAIYLPSAEMYYQGNSGGSITVVVANRININGNANFQRDTESTNVPLPSGFPGSGANDSFLVK